MSIPDVVGMVNVTTAGASTAPALTTASNGRPVLDFDGSNDYLIVPITDAMNSTSSLWLAMWVELDGAGGSDTLAITRTSDGASVDRFIWRDIGNFMQFGAGGSQRRAVYDSALPGSQYVFLTLEFDNTQDGSPTAGGSPNNRLIATANGVELPWDWGSAAENLSISLLQMTGSWRLGGYSGAGTTFSFDGRMHDVFGGTGRLTSVERTNLMTFESMLGA